VARDDNSNSFLSAAADWELAVDLANFDKYPECIRVSGLRPDIVVHTPSTKILLLVELTVPWDSRSGAARF
jgi:hypothetical protein